MTKWEAQSDSEGSDLSAREGLGSLPKHKGNVVGGGRGELHRPRGRDSNRGYNKFGDLESSEQVPPRKRHLWGLEDSPSHLPLCTPHCA